MSDRSGACDEMETGGKMKKITLTINGSRFDIDVDSEFAAYLETQIAGDFKSDANNSFKTLLQAYVRKNYELFELQKELDRLLKQVETA